MSAVAEAKHSYHPSGGPETAADQAAERRRTETLQGALLLGGYLFLHTITMGITHRGSTGHVSVQFQTLLAYGNYIFTVLGLLARAAVERLAIGEGVRRRLLGAAVALYGLGAAILFLCQAPWVYFSAGPVALAAVGYLGGEVFARFSARMAGSGYLGRAMGLGCGGCYVLQYIFQLTLDLPWLLAALMAGALALVVRELDGAGDRPDLPPPGEAEGLPRVLLRLSLIATGLFMLMAFFDETMVELAIRSGFSTVNSYGWPRLLMAGAYLVWGWLGDVDRGRYVPLVTLCVTLVSLLTPLLMDSLTLAMCLYYVSVGGVFSYSYLAFWRSAPRTVAPVLWSVMPRVIDGAVTVGFWLVNLSDLPPAAIVAMDVVLVGALVVLLARNGDLNLPPRPIEPAAGPELAAPPEAPPPRSEGETLALLSERYALSPREADVLRELVLTDHTQREIAEELGISLSTLQHHTTSIYRKTGADNRAGLHRLYREAASGEDK